jgi:NitT/TauT family transport system substrate-binding protein
MIGRMFARLMFPAFFMMLATLAASAESIAIGNYGSSANGMPFGIALAKGYFQEEGANVTGIIASEGGGTSVRNAMAGVAYGEANPGAVRRLCPRSTTWLAWRRPRRWQRAATSSAR